MKISIITAVRNGAETIGTALEGVRRQVLSAGVELEHIVIDGLSTDNTVEIIKEFGFRHPTTSTHSFNLFWLSEKDNGLYGAINNGIRMGGLSTGGLKSNVQINREDLRALRANGCWSCLPLVYTKYAFKIRGFVFRKRQAR